jgi:serine/threonine protein phosphatase PrpC
MRKIAFYGQTDVGRIRTNNEDAFQVCNIWDEDHVLAVVIDGVGGYEGGEVAAAIARDSIHEYLQNNASGDCLDLLKKAVIYANNQIFHGRSENPQLCSMSCVLTASLVELDSMRVNIAHIGDTRLYQFASGEIEKLTHDHSLIGYREEIGDLTEEEAMTHPQRNIISRDAGSGLLDESDTSYVEVASYPLEPKTQLLLCSDGLCDMVTSRRMAQILDSERTVESKVGLLIDAALEAGGRDNVTVVLVDIESDELPVEEAEIERVEVIIEQEDLPESEPGDKNSGGRKLSPYAWLVILVFVAGLAAGIIFGPMLFSDQKDSVKISADTTLVAPVDTTSNIDSSQLVSGADNGNPEIH